MPTTTPFNNLITFSRGSNATVTGPNGLIQWAPNNLLTFSEQADNAAWAKVNVTTTANSIVAPDGTTTADTVAATANGQSYIRQNATVIANTPYTTSIYLRAGTVSWCLLEIWNSGVTKWSGRYINLSTGALGGSTSGGGGLGGVFSVTDAGGGWYRIIVTATSDNTVLTPALYVADGDGNINVLAGNGISMWGAQLELGSTATTYNPTTVKNLLGFSEAFDNAAWTKSNSSIVTGAQANPVNGLFNAQKLMENTANSVHRFIVGATVTAIPYTLSIYAKAAERNWIAVGNTSGAGQLAHFNLSNGTVGTIIGGVTAAITSIGSGWYRCSVTFTPTAGAITIAVWLASADNTLTYTGDGNSGVYIYGAQLSDSASLDPYVPTPGAAPSSTVFYGPRFDFDPVTLLPRGLLVEEQRTNLTTFSDQLDNAAWSKVGATATANTTTSPDGAVNADSISASGGSTQHYVSQSFSFTSGTAYTLSVFAKKNTLNGVQLTFGSGAFGTFPYANFDVNAGTTAAFNCTSTITNFGNGWYRCTMTATASATTAAIGVIGLARDNAEARLATFSSDGNGVFAYGAQLEAGAFATSYIPTVASTVTRSADVATITGQNFAQWFRQPEGTFVVEATTSGQQFSGFYNLTGGTEQQAYDNGTANVSIKYGALNLTINLTGNRFATAYGSSGTAVFSAANNATNATAFTSTATGMEVGLSTFPRRLNGHIRNIRFIPARAADFQLQALST